MNSKRKLFAREEGENNTGRKNNPIYSIKTYYYYNVHIQVWYVVVFYEKFTMIRMY